MRWLVGLLLLLLLGLQYRLWIGAGSWAQVSALQRELAAQRQVNEQLQARNRVIEVDVQHLKNGLDGVEERARSELGMIRQGETFYLLIDKAHLPQRGR